MAGGGQTVFDAIVLGVGGMGSAACLELARRGHRVLGLEQFSLVHDRGSSHGQSRIIRKAYFEHPNYVPLLHRAYELWNDLEQAIGRELFLKTGLVLSGPAEGEAIAGARLSARLHGLEIENIDSLDATSRFPGLSFPADHEVVFEPGAGTLLVEACVQSHIEQATQLGATIRHDERAIEWSSNGETVRVKTSDAEYVARTLVVTAGAWAQQCIADLGLPFYVLRKFLGWFPVLHDQYAASKGTPAYLYEMPNGAFYGFPSLDGKTIKVAEHSNGELVTDLLNVDRSCHPSDVDRLQQFLKDQLPGVAPTLVKHSVCFYTMTPDKHFVIDVHPIWPNVVLGAGFSGHGFKFCPVVGQALADLAELGSTPLPIEFLSLSRLKVSNQNQRDAQHQS